MYQDNDNTQPMMTVMLKNMVHQSLPRVFSIRDKLEQGETLEGSELDFFIEMLEKVSHCQRQYLNDPQCRVIFATVAHLLFKVINLALENEQANLQPV